MSTALFLCFEEAIINVREIQRIEPYWSSGLPGQGDPAGVRVTFLRDGAVVYLKGKTIREVADAIVRLD